MDIILEINETLKKHRGKVGVAAGSIGTAAVAAPVVATGGQVLHQKGFDTGKSFGRSFATDKGFTDAMKRAGIEGRPVKNGLLKRGMKKLMGVQQTVQDNT